MFTNSWQVVTLQPLPSSVLAAQARYWLGRRCWFVKQQLCQLRLLLEVQAVGHLGQVASTGKFFTGSLLNSHYIVCRDADNQLRAFHNVHACCCLFFTTSWQRAFANDFAPL